MSFSIILQRNNSRDNKRVKNVVDIATLTGDLKEESSLFNPAITLKYTGNLSTCNYLTIPEFGRHYFIKDIVIKYNNIYEIKAHCDVLSSAGSELNDCLGIVRRQENSWNLYLDDGVFKAYSDPMIVTKAFPSGFTAQNFVLAVAGS